MWTPRAKKTTFACESLVEMVILQQQHLVSYVSNALFPGVVESWNDFVVPVIPQTLNPDDLLDNRFRAFDPKKENK